jgi:tRNA/tmRNA/rRNA uracil-C5-methylase (TrmA/RlmC/RlmD family)
VTSIEAPSLLELEIGNIAGGGGCVAHAPDGRVVFVRHCLPGERVMAEVTASTTRFLRADAVKILSPSTGRVDPPCPHAGPGRCGGCDFQHVSLAGQRRLKAFRVAEQLLHFTGLARDIEVEPVEGDHDGLGWRTRVRLGVDEGGRVGFHRHRSHELELVDSCPIACPEAMATGAFAAQWPGVKEIEIAVAPDRHQAVVAVVTDRMANANANAKTKSRPRTKPELPRLPTGLVVDGRVRVQPGDVHTKVGAHTFRVSAGVFWQVHVGAAQALAGAVRAELGAVAGDRVVDLYAGAGLFSVILAHEVGPSGSVLAIERDRRACADAEHNGRDLPQLTIRKASITPRLIESDLAQPDLIVLDPSREGAGQTTMAALATHAATVRRMVYVSCDPTSFGRDARVLLSAGWTLASLRVFDIFPMTEHVEMVAAFDPPSVVPARLVGDVPDGLELER